jgi:hypothetical protein
MRFIITFPARSIARHVTQSGRLGKQGSIMHSPILPILASSPPRILPRPVINDTRRGTQGQGGASKEAGKPNGLSVRSVKLTHLSRLQLAKRKREKEGLGRHRGLHEARLPHQRMLYWMHLEEW